LVDHTKNQQICESNPHLTLKALSFSFLLACQPKPLLFNKTIGKHYIVEILSEKLWKGKHKITTLNKNWKKCQTFKYSKNVILKLASFRSFSHLMLQN
jgi:hypothetical protein